MEIKVLRRAFRQQLHKVDMFYHKKLSREPRTKSMLEVHKRDLLANLFEELVKVHGHACYNNYDPAKLIFIKANKVWIDFLRSHEKNKKYSRYLSLDLIPDSYSIASFSRGMESKDTLATIREFLDPEDFQLLVYRAEGYSYKQILEITSYPSEEAAKTKYYRIKNLVKQNFRHPDF